MRFLWAVLVFVDTLKGRKDAARVAVTDFDGDGQLDCRLLEGARCRAGWSGNRTKLPKILFVARLASISIYETARFVVSATGSGFASGREGSLLFSGDSYVYGSEVLQVRACTPMLGELQVERINFLGTDVAGEDRNFTRREARPRARTELITVAANFGQVGKFFDFPITDAQAK